MKKLTYNQAYKKLEEIVEEIESNDIQLDTLAAKVKQANELVAVCEKELRSIEGDVKESKKIKG